MWNTHWPFVNYLLWKLDKMKRWLYAVRLGPHFIEPTHKYLTSSSVEKKKRLYLKAQFHLTSSMIKIWLFTPNIGWLVWQQCVFKLFQLIALPFLFFCNQIVLPSVKIRPFMVKNLVSLFCDLPLIRGSLINFLGF